MMAFGQLLVAGVAVWLLTACQSPEVKARRALLAEVMTPGVGLGQVRLGQTTLSQFESQYGPGTRESSQGQHTGCSNGLDCQTIPFETITLRYPARDSGSNSRLLCPWVLSRFCSVWV